jgi:predicted  nucleic acid-binding Zn ribbon protein
MRLFIGCAILAVTTLATGQQMFKCTVNGKVTFQQMPCSPTNVGERMVAKPLPGTGEGLREGEMDLIYQKQAEQARREAEAQASRDAYDHRQSTSMSREDEAKINNLNSDLQWRGTSPSQREAINAELSRVYEKYGVAPTSMPSPAPARPDISFGNKTINTRRGTLNCQTMTVGSQTTENCY